MDRFAFDHRYLSNQWLHRELKVGFKNLNTFSTRIGHRFFVKKNFSIPNMILKKRQKMGFLCFFLEN